MTDEEYILLKKRVQASKLKKDRIAICKSNINHYTKQCEKEKDGFDKARYNWCFDKLCHWQNELKKCLEEFKLI